MSALIVLLTIAWPSVVLAQSAEQQASAMAHRLMSPYCPGLLLADCRSDGARALRAEILQRLQGSEAPAAIEDDLVARFGPAIRTEPEFGGFGLVAWLGPLVLGVVALALLVRVLRRDASGDHSSDVAHRHELREHAGLQERLEDELKALD